MGFANRERTTMGFANRERTTMGFADRERTTMGFADRERTTMGLANRERTTMGFAMLSVPRWDLLFGAYRDGICYRRIPPWVAVVDHDGI